MSRGMFILFLISYSWVLTAQKGTMLVYGNATYHLLRKDGNWLNKSLGAFLGAGYQFSANWTIGIEIGYQESKVNGMSFLDDVERKAYRTGIFAQYFIPLNERFGFFTDIISGYSAYRGNTISKTNHVYAGIFPAIYFFIGKDWGVYLIPASLDFSPFYNTKVSLSINTYPVIGISKNIAVQKQAKE